MSGETLRRLNEARDAGAKFVRDHIKGKGGVGFGDVEETPLVTDTFEVIGKSYTVTVENGIKVVTPRARAVLLSSGEIEIIKGGIGAAVSEEDARKILNQSQKNRLTRVLKPKK